MTIRNNNLKELYKVSMKYTPEEKREWYVVVNNEEELYRFYPPVLFSYIEFEKVGPVQCVECMIRANKDAASLIRTPPGKLSDAL